MHLEEVVVVVVVVVVVELQWEVARGLVVRRVVWGVGWKAALHAKVGVC